MIRTLAVMAAISFVLSLVCLSAAFTIAGGPFTIDDGWRFRRGEWNIDLSTADDAPGAKTVRGQIVQMTVQRAGTERSAPARDRAINALVSASPKIAANDPNRGPWFWPSRTS